MRFYFYFWHKKSVCVSDLSTIRWLVKLSFSFWKLETRTSLSFYYTNCTDIQFNVEYFIVMFLIRVEDDGKVAEELKRADAVVLTYACDEPSTLERLSSFWLPKLRKLEVSILHFSIVFQCSFYMHCLRQDSSQGIF